MFLALLGVPAAAPPLCRAPPTWPAQFVIVQRKIPDDDSGNATTTTYYDWKRQANLIVITPDSNETDVLWDLELGSHHSFYFFPSRRSCKAMTFPVGMLRPDWLANATCLGPRQLNGRATIAWTKVDFITYYADAVTLEPVSWYFHTMKARFDTIYYAPGQQIEDAAHFLPPEYCSSQAGAAPPVAVSHGVPNA